ncbi:L-cystine transport system permease protein TcyB [compost metagenome]|jgi:polar amino acid transport system permease protein|uniref:amino acid ABC transporter permease n=1 Tax=Achromobacter sp. Root83 TaxID=1736602 RepID=UPI00070D8251|nr:amino acid ABC transporter permease [Achromobacter sp. Root83]KRC76622.1 polar amino acid ABC transporter permease [Achromobacter sp. Root83]
MDLNALLFSFFNAEVAWRYLPDILAGMWITLQLGVAVAATGVALGLVLAVLRALRIRPLNFLIICFADILRALPPLVVIMVLFFAFPYINLSMSAFMACWLSLSLVLAAFAEEIFWAGILSVPRGQAEAARSTGLNWLQSMVYVVMPQAMRLTVAPLTNRVIAITKSTALGSVVGLSEVLNNAQSASSNAGNATPLTLAAVACLLIFLPVVVLGRWTETRFKWKH